ncbi:hypothetical protein AVEN_259508-1 [Araneus ventricosus]|uniref:Uncharacterized protein n=1 Tax=Araneus ventricosus TaxID=182803 RepID=A0A4Y2UH76_ARAVE|nr:hypothetical protein AVEN_259508-1 [Araneus ventricosus]
MFNAHWSQAHVQCPVHLSQAHELCPFHLSQAHVQCPFHLSQAHVQCPFHLSQAHVQYPFHLSQAHVQHFGSSTCVQSMPSPFESNCSMRVMRVQQCREGFLEQLQQHGVLCLLSIQQQRESRGFKTGEQGGQVGFSKHSS